MQLAVSGKLYIQSARNEKATLANHTAKGEISEEKF